MTGFCPKQFGLELAHFGTWRNENKNILRHLQNAKSPAQFEKLHN